MCDLDLLTPNSAHELNVMIARNAESRSSIDHSFHKLNDLWDFRPTIDQIPNENCFPSGWRLCSTVLISCIAELFQQLQQLVITTMDVADNVERPMLMVQIVPQRLAHNLSGINLF